MTEGASTNKAPTHRTSTSKIMAVGWILAVGYLCLEVSVGNESGIPLQNDGQHSSMALAASANPDLRFRMVQLEDELLTLQRAVRPQAELITAVAALELEVATLNAALGGYGPRSENEVPAQFSAYPVTPFDPSGEASRLD